MFLANFIPCYIVGCMGSRADKPGRGYVDMDMGSCINYSGVGAVVLTNILASCCRASLRLSGMVIRRVTSTGLRSMTVSS